MSYRLARLLSATLLGACTAATGLAATKAAHPSKAKAAAEAEAAPALIWRGDITTARGVVTDVAKTYQKAGHGRIELQPFNTASGLDAVAKGTADLAGSARGSSGSASEAALTFTPVAWDALVMITSPDNPVSSLTLPQLHDIYYGKITNWKDVGGNDQPIDLYAVASPGDGVEYSLRSLLFGRGNQPVAAPRLYVNTAKLEEAITLDPKGLGASTMAGVRGNSKVKMIKIDGVAPSSASVGSGSYPLFTPLYLVTNSTSPKAADTKAFIDFLTTSQAKAVLRQHDVLPYDDGAMLASMDGSRRSKILAEVGAHASGPLQTLPTSVAAASPTLVASASQPAKAAAAAVGKSGKAAELAAERAATKSQFAAVSATVTSTAKPSFKGVRGDAITVAALPNRDKLFARVTADVFTTAHSKASTALADKADKALAAKARLLAATVEKPASTPVKLERTQPKADRPAAKATLAHAGRGRTYKVGAGDTLYSIARKHEVDVAQVRAWNGMRDNTVRPGQVLRISAR